MIGVGIDLGALHVFWTQGGLYRGVLADTATLLGVVREATGTGEAAAVHTPLSSFIHKTAPSDGAVAVLWRWCADRLGETELRRMLPEAFCPAVTVRG